MKNKIEQKLDDAFKEMDVKPYIFHFFDVTPFNAVTIASFHSSFREIMGFIEDAVDLPLLMFNPASYLITHLQGTHRIFGIAICDTRDLFNRQRGRIIAKGRLLKHLKEVTK